MLSVSAVEWWGPSLTDCGRLDRKFLIQLQVGRGICSSSSLVMRMSGIMVLNAEL